LAPSNPSRSHQAFTNPLPGTKTGVNGGKQKMNHKLYPAHENSH